MEKPDDIAEPAKGFDTAEILRIAGGLWAGRLLVTATMIFALLFAILYLHIANYTYTTSLTLIPTQSQQQNMTQQLGGLAAMAGINLPSGSATSVTPFTVYPETAHTRQVAVEMIRIWPGVMPALFRDQWDPEKKTWHAPHSLRFALLVFLRPLLGAPAYSWTAPGPAELQNHIANGVAITQDKKKPILVIAVSTPNPDFGRKFVLTLHQATDQILRRMTLDRAKKYAAYLEQKLAQPQASATRDVLTQSLSDQETLVMMGNSDTDFAAQPLGLAESSIRPTNPVPAIVLVVALLVGLVTGGLLVVFVVPLVEGSARLRKTMLGSSLVKFGKGHRQ